MDVKASDEQVEFKIPISNRDSRPIRIVGMRSNCSCTQSNLPIEILPNDTSEVVVRMAIGSLLLTEDCITKEVCLIPDRGDQGIDVTLNARKSQEE